MSEESLRSALRLSPDHPWPGLESFDEACNAFFFGMQAETAALFRLVRRETLTLFYGRSGLGKTSLLQAGLFRDCARRTCCPSQSGRIMDQRRRPW